jgi:glucan biosynthesis protein
VRGADYTKYRYHTFKTCWKNDLSSVQLQVKFFKHIVNVNSHVKIMKSQLAQTVQMLKPRLKELLKSGQIKD